MSVALVVPAAGSGERLGLPLPKALADLAGAPLVRRTLERLAITKAFSETVVLVPAAHLSAFEQALAGLPAGLGTVLVRPGGSSRQASVWAGLEAIGPACDLICVHDAARPLIEPATVIKVMDEARRHGAATAASRPADSVRIDVAEGTKALDRRRLWLVETPQVFEASVLRRAHEHARAGGVEGTDDASLVEALGLEIRIVASQGCNLKVTNRADLIAARELLAFSAAAPH
ncbi:MAG TPA: 2-C-methyl-D-erythritol 4-phosphate cytidylyltransferase [Candidatus Binatia bacterium]|nr:2-C-methyl-D-erythritol 4-phosphate cytidylyltransferase [Candidatus Binatia bacterium]